jgi:hypothetical protein
MDEKYTNIKERLLYFAKNQSIGIENFLENIGMTYGSFKGKAKEGSLNSNALVEIYTKYPEINIEWLLTGTGNMLNENLNLVREPEESYNLPDDDVMYIDESREPEVFYNERTGNKYFIYHDGTIRIEVLKIPFVAYASYVECFDDEVKLNQEFSKITFKVDHIGRGKYLGFESKGNSMWNNGGYDTPTGADILGREIGRHLWMSGFNKSKYGFILITHKGIYHKDIEKIDDEGHLILTSRNPNDEPFRCSLNEINEIYHVIKRTF